MPVDTPMPDECFRDHQVIPLPEVLTFRAYQAWVDSIIDSVLGYQQQMERCRDLNQRRFEDDQAART